MAGGGGLNPDSLASSTSAIPASGSHAIAPGQASSLNIGGVSSPGKVTLIENLQTQAQAVPGFPVINGTDMSVLGLQNDTTTTGSCCLTFQVRFTVSGVASAEVGLTRTKKGTAFATINGQRKTQPKDGLDGPSDPTVLRPNSTRNRCL